MMKCNVGRDRRWLVVPVGLAALVLALAGPSAVYAGPPGVDIKIRAQNRSTADTPFCGIGGGLVGDRLDVDAFMDTTGAVTGTARFEDALGNVTIIELDRLFTFGFGGGFLVQNEASQDTVAFWLSDTLAPFTEPAQVNVELPRGCGNTVSTFTPGVDKVTVQIKFR